MFPKPHFVLGLQLILATLQGSRVPTLEKRVSFSYKLLSPSNTENSNLPYPRFPRPTFQRSWEKKKKTSFKVAKP